MQFSEFTKSKGMVGQRKLLVRLDLYTESILFDGERINLLIQGRSGFGKTYTIDLLLEYFDGMLIAMAIEEDKKLPVWKQRKKEYLSFVSTENGGTGEGTFVHSQIATAGGFIELPEGHFVYFVDEAHLIPNPEFFYGIMSDKNKILILATDQPSRLATPLRNRFKDPLKIVSYSKDELLQIALNNLAEYGITQENLAPDFAEFIVAIAKDVPRRVKHLAHDIYISLKSAKRKLKNVTSSDVIEHVKDFLGVRNDGLTDEDRKYIVKLYKNGGKAGLRLLAQLTGLLKEDIEEMETYLMDEGYIIRPHSRLITPKGTRLAKELLREQKLEKGK